jgi:hypothetical protein
LWLRLTGDEGAKEYMRSVFETHDLLSEQVARAAGIKITLIPPTGVETQ